jgi:DNA-binding LytR/AlgR family response regulator
MTRTKAARMGASGDQRQQGLEDSRLRAILTARRSARRLRSEYLTRIPVRNRTTILLVPISQVVAIAADGSKLTIITRDHQQHSWEYRLKDLEARLDPAVFMRLNRGALVNVNAVSRVVGAAGGTSRVVLENGQELAMSRKQSQRLRRVLLRLLG